MKWCEESVEKWTLVEYLNQKNNAETILLNLENLSFLVIAEEIHISLNVTTKFSWEGTNVIFPTFLLVGVFQRLWSVATGTTQISPHMYTNTIGLLLMTMLHQLHQMFYIKTKVKKTKSFRDILNNILKNILQVIKRNIRLLHLTVSHIYQKNW